MPNKFYSLSLFHFVAHRPLKGPCNCGIKGFDVIIMGFFSENNLLNYLQWLFLSEDKLATA